MITSKRGILRAEILHKAYFRFAKIIAKLLNNVVYMKKGILLTVFAALVSVIVYSYQGGAANNGGIDGTKASGGSGGCGSCHGSGTDNVKVELDSAGVAVTSYHPGASYTVKISATNTSTTSLTHFGFQVAVVKSSGAGTGSATSIGTWGTLPTYVQLTTAANSGLPEDVIEQSRAITATSGTGGNGSTYVESVPWTAPASGSGSVIIYGVMNEASSQSTSKYQVATPVTITEATAVAPAASVSISETSGGTSICSGSSVTFGATPTNGGTAPTYQWKVNGTAVSGATSSTFSTTTLAAGSNAVTCVMTSNLTGVTGNPATSNTITVTVNASVTPSVSITSTTTSICSGQSVTFTATPTNGGTAPTYQWKNNGSVISGATSSTYSSTSLANNSIITCVLTSNASCPTTSTATSNSITISIVTSVTPSVSIASGAGSSICSGQSVTLTATPTNGGTSPTYQWYKNGSAISGATASTYSTTTLANSNIITCILTSNASCLSTTTATSNAITFTITANGAASVSIAASPGNSVCSGQNVTFTATPVNGGTAPTYQWYKGNTAINGATSSTYSSTTFANGDVITCKIVSNSQCVTTSNATSNAITINISGAITPAVTIISGSGTSICSGQNVTFTASPVNGGSSPTYQWYNGGTAISGATSSTYSSSTLGNSAAISVVLTSSSSCASPTTATSNIINISVSTGGTATVILSSSVGTSICNGQSGTLSATPVNGGSSPAYQWMKNGNNISGATSATYSPSSIANGDVYIVQLTSSSTCVSQQVVVSSPLTFSVVQGGPAVVSVSSNVGLNICQGVGVTFNATAVNGGSSPVYQWSKNGNTVGNGSAAYIDNGLVDGDVINCSVTSTLSCASPNTASSNSLTMNVFAAPVANVVDSSGILVSSPGSFYQWYVNNISVGGASSQRLTPPGNGNYTVEVTDIHGCQNISTPYDVTFAGIAEPSALAGISVYPNPVDNTLFVDFKGSIGEGKVAVRLLDMKGRVLIASDNTPVSGEKISMDMTGIATGIYLVQISQNEASVYRKLIVGR